MGSDDRGGETEIRRVMVPGDLVVALHNAISDAVNKWYWDQGLDIDTITGLTALELATQLLQERLLGDPEPGTIQ